MRNSKFIISVAFAVNAIVGINTASAADLPVKAPSRAASVMAPGYNWTGFNIFGGGGYGLFESEEYSVGTPNTFATTPGLATSGSNRLGGHGWFGTVGVGYDMQFGGAWVAGVFVDGQFGSIKGTLLDEEDARSGSIKNRTNVAVGLRLGYLVAPNVLSYVNGGYSYAEFSGSTLVSTTGDPFNFSTTTRGFHRDGWFVGGGVEHSLDFFGSASPGWFLKTEYRLAQYDRRDVFEYDLDGTLNDSFISTKSIVQTISTSLVYRFNWGGPVVAKY